MIRPAAPIVEFTVFKDQPNSGGIQVPAEATVEFFRQGATVSAGATVPPYTADFSISVHDVGDLEANDAVQLDAASSSLVVTGVLAPGELLVSNFTNVAVVLNAGDRLTPVGNRPTVHPDPVCTVGAAHFLPTDPATGRANGYISRNRVDVQVFVSGEAPRVFTDVAGRHGRSDGPSLDLRDFAGDLQAAVDELPAEGGSIFVPVNVPPMPTGVVISKPNVTLLGEPQASALRLAVPNSHDLITVQGVPLRIRDLILDGDHQVVPPNPKSGIVVDGAGARLILDRVILQAFPRYGLWFRGGASLHASASWFVYCLDSGVRIEGATNGRTAAYLTSIVSNQNGNRGLEAIGLGSLLLQDGTFEGNRAGVGATEGNGVDVEASLGVALRACYFEDARTEPRAHQFVALRGCPAAIVDGCHFQGGIDEEQAPYRPRRAAEFFDSSSTRFTNNGAEQMFEHMAHFDAGSPDCVEWGNRDAGAAIARMSFGAVRFFSMGRRALGVPTHLAGAGTLPAPGSVPEGSLAFVKDPGTGTGQLQVRALGEWKVVSTVP